MANAGLERGPASPTLEGDAADIARATEDVPNQDVIYERMAHGFVYDGVNGADVGKLRVWGYEPGPIHEGQYGFRMMAFLPIPDATEAQKAALGAELRPVLAFRGTAEEKGAIDDANPAGIGRYQFAANEPAIAGQLSALEAHGKVDVVGHSLGGALAQLAACTYSGGVGRIVTYQSPGINADQAASLDDWNNEQAERGGHEITSTHHRVTTDVVSMAGEAYTRGDVVAYELDTLSLIGTAGGHTAHPLSQLTDGTGVPRVAGIGSVGGKENVAGATRFDTAGPSTGGQSALEGVRRDAGRVVYNETGNENALYVNVWDTLKPKLATGRLLLSDYDEIVESSPLSASNQVLLRLNARELFPELNQAHKLLEAGTPADDLLGAVTGALGALDAAQAERVNTYGQRYAQKA